MMQNVELWGASDRGQARPTNEDAIYLVNGDEFATATLGYLFAVADGVADPEGTINDMSQLMLEQLAKVYYGLTDGNPAGNLQQAILTTHKTIRRQHTPTPISATTLVAALIHNQQLFVANIGNSRAYLVRDTQIWQLTKDHTTPDGKLTHYLIASEEASPDLFKPVDLQIGDYVLLCSDGLHAALSEADIAQQFNGRSPQAIAQRLIQQANTADGTDNIAAVIAHLPPEVTSATPLTKQQIAILAILAFLIISLLLWLIIELIRL